MVDVCGAAVQPVRFRAGHAQRRGVVLLRVGRHDQARTLYRTDSQMSRRTQLVVGILLAAALVYWFLRQADLRQVLAIVRDADPALVVASVGTVFLTSVQRAWRWRLLLRGQATCAVRTLWECIAMGWGINVLFPGRLGEVGRAVLLSRRAPVSASVALGSVVLERVFDVVAILALLGAYLALAPEPTALGAAGAGTLASLRSVGMILLAGILLTWVLLLLAVRQEHWLARLREVVRRLLPTRLASALAGFLGGMSSGRDVGLALRVMLASLLLWSTVVVTYVLLFHAIGLAVPWYGAVPLLALLVVGAAVPTPAGVGSFHKVAQLGLTGLFAVPNDAAVAYGILGHAVAFLPLAAVGVLLLMRAGYGAASVRDLRADLRAGHDGAGL